MTSIDCLKLRANLAGSEQSSKVSPATAANEVGCMSRATLTLNSVASNRESLDRDFVAIRLRLLRTALNDRFSPNIGRPQDGV